MILEFAQLTIKASTEAQFEAIFPAAIPHIAQSPGYLGHELQRCIETPTRYALLIKWRALEDHTVGFRGSPAFARWRAQIGPFLDGTPVVEHFERKF